MRPFPSTTEVVKMCGVPSLHSDMASVKRAMFFLTTLGFTLSALVKAKAKAKEKAKAGTTLKMYSKGVLALEVNLEALLAGIDLDTVEDLKACEYIEPGFLERMTTGDGRVEK